jgi:hypothetical protein
VERVTLNVSQQIFLVFFAIFWGTLANAWPKRKPFHWPFVLYSCRVAARVALSVLMLNVVPVLYFGWVLMELGRAANHPVVVWCDVVAGATPAFGIFGFYRIWIAFTEFSPPRFYYWDRAEQARRRPNLQGADPTIEKLYPWRAPWMNLMFGVIYVVVPCAVGLFACVWSVGSSPNP